MVAQRIVMGEGFLRKMIPSPIITHGNTELPSPASELGFTRVRHFRMAEVG